VQKSGRSIARRERLKAFTEEKLVTSHSKLFQTLITRCEKTQDCNKIQNRDILVLANPGPPGKWSIKRTERELYLHAIANSQ